LLPVIGEGDLPKAYPRDHSADEAGLLRHCQQDIKRPPGHQPKIAGVERDVDLRRARQQPVEAVRRRPLERGFAGAAVAHSINHVGAVLAHGLEHPGQQFGRVLQIGVDDQDGVTAAQVESRGQRQLVTVIARQVDRDQVRILGREFLHDRPARIARAVIHQNDLIILAHRLSGGRAEALMKRSKAGFLVEAGDDDRQHHGWRR
jgi:hypothetical protein